MKTLRMIGMALVAVLMCVNFASCSSSDDEDGDYVQTELIVNGMPFMANAFCGYDAESGDRIDACSTYEYGTIKHDYGEGNRISYYFEDFYGEVDGKLTDGLYCKVNIRLEGIKMGVNKTSLNPFKESNLDISKYPQNYSFLIEIYDEPSYDFFEYSSALHCSGGIYIKSFSLNILTLSFDSYNMMDKDGNSITLNGDINFKYKKIDKSYAEW